MKRFVLILLIFGVCLFSQITTKTLFEDGWKIFGEETFVEKPSLPLTMIVYGDSRWGNQTHRRLVELMDEYKPTVVVHLGDMVNSGDNQKEWEIFFEITSPLRSYAFFQPVKGNHEKPDVYYKQHFGLYNYWARVEDYVFIFLDPDTGVKRCESFIRSIDLSGKNPDRFFALSHLQWWAPRKDADCEEPAGSARCLSRVERTADLQRARSQLSEDCERRNNIHRHRWRGCPAVQIRFDRRTCGRSCCPSLREGEPLQG